MATQPKHFVTVEEYLASEETALDRHEYLNGEVFAMAGASLRHELIALNLAGELRSRLLRSGCRVRGSGARLRTSPTGLYSYADVVISCTPEQADRNTLLNPIVIGEVLSTSTGDYDRGAKFERYRQIASFREYLIVAQDRVYVEHHVRTGALRDSVWTMREFTSPDDIINLQSVGVDLPCSAIYADVDFTEEADLQEAN
ncbi:MAG: Uma2 family endonuclease [Bryobacteraceae bacterium]